MNCKERPIGGKRVVIETGKIANQADSSVVVRWGETVVLTTVCVSKMPREKVDFFPLTVDYEERHYAAGKIPGGFFKREGRPSSDAILIDRLIDRQLRPLFPKGFRNDVQVIVTVLSADQENAADIAAVIGASTAVMLSGAPFGGPVGATRVGYINGRFVANPTFTELQNSPIDVVVAGTKEAVVMVEAEAKEAGEDVILEAIKFGQTVNQEVIELEEELIRNNKKPTIDFKPILPDTQLVQDITSQFGQRVSEAVVIGDRVKREELLNQIRAEILLKAGETKESEVIVLVLDEVIKKALRTNILNDNRADNRKPTEIRPISCEVGLLPRTHGSGLFTRGQTQVLTITTLGSPGEEQILDGLTPEESKRFMHHYNFPPFSTGEVKRLGGPGRREIGHGALVERALLPVLPGESDFPYTIRLVSEVLSSSGSTSMASVCGCSLSLMDAGVPIKMPVAGVAMGLVTSENGDYKILTDIEGLEDAYGDMDFKIAGTTSGITAIQLDIKLKGIGFEIIEKTLKQAKEARGFILNKMRETISQSRSELSKYAPRMSIIHIEPSKIGSVIGAGGKTIRQIIEETKATIDIKDDGSVVIGSTTAEGAVKAIQMIENLTRDIEVGAIYTGKVTRILNFGALVEILPGKEGLVHISELADHRVGKVEDVVKVGDEIMVMVTEIDRLGRVNLSRKAVNQGSSKGAGTIQ